MRTFRVVQDDLTAGDSLVLVNAANTNVALGSGVSGAIRAACGRGFQEHIAAALQERFGGPMEPGQVLITDAGTHPRARFVAHVAVMDYRNGFTADSFPSLELVERCCHNLWEALETVGERPLSVAMVALGAGTGRIGLRDSTEAACRTLRAHLEAHPDSAIGDVTFYGFQVQEYLNMLDVVMNHFEVPRDSIPKEALEFLKR